MATKNNRDDAQARVLQFPSERAGLGGVPGDEFGSEDYVEVYRPLIGKVTYFTIADGRVLVERLERVMELDEYMREFPRESADVCQESRQTFGHVHRYMERSK